MTAGLDSLPASIAAHVARAMPALRDAPLLLAASGGADSTALVSLLCESGIADPARAAIAHFDHRLRSPAESAADRAAVRALADRYRLPVLEGAWDAVRPSEAAARDARYAFLAEAARSSGATHVVTGHTLDDQAETVLMRAMRGAGLHGLAGMAPLSSWPLGGDVMLAVARPLLDVPRESTRAWCAHRGLAFHDDASNNDRAFARNRLRLDVLPMLARAQPDITARMAELAAHARIAADALDAAAAPAVSVHGDIVRIERGGVLAEAPDLAAHASRIALKRLLGDAREYDRRHYTGLARAIAAGATGATLHLPRRVVATIDRDAVLLSVGALVAPAIEPAFGDPLPFEGEAGAWTLRIQSADHGIALPSGAIVRARRPGDRVHLASGRRVKLQDLFVDRHVPRRLRDATPVVATGGDVWWTPWSHAVAIEGETYAIDAEIAPMWTLGAPAP